MNFTEEICTGAGRSRVPDLPSDDLNRFLRERPIGQAVLVRINELKSSLPAQLLVQEMFDRLLDAVIQLVGFDCRMAQEHVSGKPHSPGFDLLEECLQRRHAFCCSVSSAASKNRALPDVR